MGQANFFYNPQILGFIPLSQTRKFIRFASPQIGKPAKLYNYLRIAIPQIITKYRTTQFQNGLKSSLLSDFLMYLS